MTQTDQGDLQDAYRNRFHEMIRVATTSFELINHYIPMAVAFCARKRPQDDLRKAEDIADFQTMFTIFNDPLPVMLFGAPETTDPVPCYFENRNSGEVTIIQKGTVTHVALFHIITDPFRILDPVVVSPSAGAPTKVRPWDTSQFRPGDLRVGLIETPAYITDPGFPFL